MSQDLISLRILEVLERLSVQQASSDKSSSPTTATHIAKAPDAFKGSPKELENFLSSCVLYMDAYPGTFKSDKSRINFIISHCRGSVLQSLRPLINRAEQPSMLHDYQEFLIYLRRHWGDPDEKGNAKRELRGLRQKGSASDFFLRLNQLLAVLDIPNDADLLVENTIYKLDGTLRDEIARNQDFDPKSIDELMDFIIPLDNRLREREKEKRETQSSEPRNSSQTSAFRPTTTSTFNRNTQNHATAPNFRFGPISTEEKDRRRANKLCMYCGGAGHIADVCPQKGKAPARKV